MAYKSGNPALNKDTFTDLPAVADGEAMTLDGVVNKSLIMFILAAAAGVFGWHLAATESPLTGPVLIGALISAFIISLVAIFKKTTARWTAPLYALLEGLVLGIISQLYNTAFAGIVLEALLLTAGIFLCMLVIYRSRIIRVTENFKMGIAAATGGIALYYVAYMLGGLFHYQLPLVNSNSGFGIWFSILVIVIAALNLVVDFDFIEQGVEHKAPKYMEWYASFGLFVTIVWLYLEILRLLAKSRSR